MDTENVSWVRWNCWVVDRYVLVEFVGEAMKFGLSARDDRFRGSVRARQEKYATRMGSRGNKAP